MRPTSLEQLGERFEEAPQDLEGERAKLLAWVRESIAAATTRPGLFRAWLVTSNHDAAVVAERQKHAEANVERMRRYLAALHVTGLAKNEQAPFAAYAIIALVGAAAREAAMDREFSEAKHRGIISVVFDLAGIA